MAAKTIKGIYVEIGGSTKKLSEALKSAETPASNLQSSLNKVNQALKLDPSNTELVAEKQKILASYVDVTREKLETLEGVQDQIRQQYANGTIDQGAYLDFQKELEYTRDKLKNLETQQRDFSDTAKKSLAEASKSCEDLEKNLSKVDAALELDSSNVNLLKQKQDLLTDSIDETRKKLQLMREQQEKISAEYAAGNIDRGAYTEFQTELSATKQKLKELKEEQKEFGSVATQVMQEAGSKVAEFGDKVSGAGEKLLPATGIIVAAGAAAVNAGSDIMESQNKVEVAFGDSADRIKEFADTTLDVYGIAKGTALDMAALYGDMATSMELPQNAAAEMSESLVGLAGDLASFKNLDLQQAQDALKGIFTGETESLKNLGVVMTQDNLLRYAMQQGMIDTTKSAQQLAKEELALEKAQTSYNTAVKKYGKNSIQAREAALKVSDAEAKLNESAKASLDTLSTSEMVQLRYAYVLNATKNAQGDFANTSDGAANSMRVASEAVKEVSADFGILLAPYAAQAAQMVSELLKSIIALPEEQKKIVLMVAAMVAGLGPLLIIGGKIISGAGSIISLIGQLPALMSAVKSGFTVASGVMSGAFSGAISTVSSGLSFLAANPIVLIIAGIVALIAIFVTAYNKCEWFRDGVNNAIASVKEWWGNTVEGVKDILRGLSEKWEQVTSGIKNFTSSAMSVASETAREKLADMRNAYEANGGGIRGIVAATMEGIKGDYTAGWTFVDKLTGGKLTSLTSNIRDKMASARETIANAIEKIKKIFDFEWKWPKMKLPHFSITGSFSLDPPSIPKISVQWYKHGGILNGATLFGSLGNKLLGGGEAGPEAVLPLASFYDNLRNILSSFIGTVSASRIVKVDVNIEHFENHSDADLDGIVDYVEDKVQSKIERKEAAWA